MRPGSSCGERTFATGTEKIAPIEARTALCDHGSAQPGPSATELAPNASALRMIVPTLPGSPTPHSATHSGPTGWAQRIGYTPIARVPEPSWDTDGITCDATGMPSSPESGR